MLGRGEDTTVLNRGLKASHTDSDVTDGENCPPPTRGRAFHANAIITFEGYEKQ